MPEPADSRSVADLLGPWVDPNWNSGLVERCRRAWNKPLRELSNEELATLLGQRIATDQLLPLAESRVALGFDDDTELYDGELEAAIEHAKKGI
jgi:hypothetical protein